jgi:GT2 family glycosyltransferase
MKKLGIIIPAYRKPATLHRLIDQLVNLEPLPGWQYFIYCIINGWHNAPQAMVELYLDSMAKYCVYLESVNRELFLSPKLNFILCDYNYMFSRAINLGLGLIIDHHYALLVNDDCYMKDMNSIDEMINFMEEHHNIASISPVTYKSDGSIYCAGGCAGGGHYSDQPIEPRQVKWNNFAVCMLNMNVVKMIGTLRTDTVAPDRFHHYGSDEEWCNRATEDNFLHYNHPSKWMHYYQENVK